MVSAPTTKAVGSNFVKYFEPTALVVGRKTKQPTALVVGRKTKQPTALVVGRKSNYLVVGL
jgi:hypothetical protein